MSDCAAYCLSRHMGKATPLGNLPGDLSVGGGFSIRNGKENFPYLFLKICADQMQRRKKIRLFSGKVKIKPCFCLIKYRQISLFLLFFQASGKIFLSMEP